MTDYGSRIVRTLEEQIGTGTMSGASVIATRRDETLFEATVGTMGWADSNRAVTPDDVFLIASITKPMVTSRVALLVEAGGVSLDDRVADHIPEFAAHDKGSVLVRHCMTHTSGLPDMVPGDHELRLRNAPLSEYVASACEAELKFRPGTSVSYQSSGILMLSEIAERVTGQPMRTQLSNSIFGPAGMPDTHLGWRPDFEGRRVSARPGQEPDNWGWDSDYWKDLGAPWGGAHSTARDISVFLRTVLAGDQAPNGRQIFSGPLAHDLVTDRIAGMTEIPPELRSTEGWGLGWRIKKAADTLTAGALIGSFGHSGATGTLAWAEPKSGVVFVLLTNDAMQSDVVGRCSETAAEALCA